MRSRLSERETQAQEDEHAAGHTRDERCSLGVPHEGIAHLAGGERENQAPRRARANERRAENQEREHLRRALRVDELYRPIAAASV